MKILVITCLLISTASFANNIDSTQPYAWSENVGWLNFADNNGGVSVYDDHLEGFAWGANIGWVRLGTHTSGGAHSYANSNANDYGVNVGSDGELSGYAWSEVAGWISFDKTNLQGEKVSINKQTGEFNGYAWGENIGWVSFSAPSQYSVRTSHEFSLESDSNDSKKTNNNKVVTNVSDNNAVTNASDNNAVTNVSDNNVVTNANDNNAVTNVSDNHTVTNASGNNSATNVSDNNTITHSNDTNVVTNIVNNNNAATDANNNIVTNVSNNNTPNTNTSGAGRQLLGSNSIFGAKVAANRKFYNPIIRGQLDNQGFIQSATLEAESIARNGTWSGTIKLANAAQLHDARLQTGTVVDGGSIGGVIDGDVVSQGQRKTISKARLQNVQILPETLLRSVIIGENVSLPEDLTQIALDEGVEFADKTLIPSQLELINIFKQQDTLNFEQAFIADESETLDQKISNISDFLNGEQKITAVEDKLQLVVEDVLRFVVKPRSIKHSDNNDQVQILGQNFALTTPDGFNVEIVPSIQAMPVLKQQLQLSDDNIRADDQGNLWLTLGDDTAFEAVVRGQWSATRLSEVQAEGLYSDNNAVGLPLFYLVSNDDDGTWQQVVYPTTPDLAGLQQQADDVRLDEFGYLSFALDEVTYQGYLSYLVVKTPALGQLSVTLGEQGTVLINYPNGYQQHLHH